MVRKTLAFVLIVLFLASAMVHFNQNNTSFVSANDAFKLGLMAAPTSVLADNSTYHCIYVQLQDVSGQPVRALQDTTISLSSSQTNIGIVDSSITIPKGETYASADFSTTFSPGTTTISATATGYATVQVPVSTIGPIPSAVAAYGIPSTLPADGNTFSAILLQLQDSSGNPARASQGGVNVTLLSSDTSVGVVSPYALIAEGQTYAIANFTTTTKAQTEGTLETATITALSPGYTPNQVTITTTPIAANPSQLKVFVGPPKLPADKNSYTQIAVELQNASGYIAVNQEDITVTMVSNDESICKIHPIIIPRTQPYALATLNTTYKAGSATLTAVATDLQWDHQGISTFGFIPSKLVVYSLPANMPADNKTYSTIQVQLQDAQGRPAKDPQSDVSVNLFSSQPTVGTVSTILVIPFGKTEATGILTVTNAPGTSTITAQTSGYTTGFASLTTTLIDYSQLQVALTANPSNVTNAYTTILTAFVSVNGAPITGVALSFVSNNGGSFGNVNEQGSGYYNVSFTSPSFSSVSTCTITTTGVRTGYLTAQSSTQITVNPTPAPTATPTLSLTPSPTPTQAPTPSPSPSSTPVSTVVSQIEFQITDRNGVPLNDTLVSSIVQPTGAQPLLQVSNATGYVSFQNLEVGNYTFKIVKAGFSLLNETMSYDGQPITLSIPLVSTDESINKNSSFINQIVILAIIIASVATVIATILLFSRRRKSGNVKNLIELKKQMAAKKKSAS
jgi:hypothetical protein